MQRDVWCTSIDRVCFRMTFVVVEKETTLFFYSPGVWHIPSQELSKDKAVRTGIWGAK